MRKLINLLTITSLVFTLCLPLRIFGETTLRAESIVVFYRGIKRAKPGITQLYQSDHGLSLAQASLGSLYGSALPHQISDEDLQEICAVVKVVGTPGRVDIRSLYVLIIYEDESYSKYYLGEQASNTVFGEVATADESSAIYAMLYNLSNVQP